VSFSNHESRFSQLGFINPLLYSLSATNPEAFNDIVMGSNADGDWQLRGSPYPIQCKYGFYAAPGYDPASGIGTINYPILLDLIPVVRDTGEIH
jgi:tripeptidyl-peptidase-1